MALFLLQNTNSKVFICAKQQIPKYNLRHCALFKAADPRIPPPTLGTLSMLKKMSTTVNMLPFVQKKWFVHDFQKQILSLYSHGFEISISVLFRLPLRISEISCQKYFQAVVFGIQVFLPRLQILVKIISICQVANIGAVWPHFRYEKFCPIDAKSGKRRK